MWRNICSTTCDARTKFEGIEVSEATRLRTLEEENSRLKRLVADQAVQIHILKEVNAKSGEPLCKTTGGEDECRRRHWKSGQGVSGAGTVAVKLISQLAIENESGASARKCSSSARKSSRLRGDGDPATPSSLRLAPDDLPKIDSNVAYVSFSTVS